MANVYQSVLGSGGGVTPTSITPSNSSPVTLTSGEVYQPTANGKAVSSVDDLTPGNVDPPIIERGKVYKATLDGYGVRTLPESVTPSDANPPSLSNARSYNPSAVGYLCATKRTSGTASSDGSASSEFTCDTNLTTVKRFFAWGLSGASNQNTSVVIYDYNVLNGQFSSASIQTSAAAQRPRASIGANPTAYNASIMSITSGVVNLKNPTAAQNAFKGTVYWYAEGT